MKIVTILSMLIGVTGCAGSLTCQWESDEEQMQRILHEVEHLMEDSVEAID